MTVSTTSIEAYIEHKETGKIGKQASTILNKMDPNCDYSRKELARLTGFELASICGRVNELLAIGLLDELASRKCSITGKNIHPIQLRNHANCQTTLF
tara:strand:- start:53 stop:346 length:294 start_codon:yes stop_codon:yes gene_type:complete